MAKKCGVCGDPATLGIKGTSDYYCEECAEDSFSDNELLENLEEAEAQARELAKQLNESVEQSNFRNQSP